MDTERFANRHRRMPYLMWPGVMLALPAIGCIWYSTASMEGSIGNAVVMLLVLFAYAVGWLWTLLLGLPSALYSLYLERNAALPLPRQTFARACVAIALFSILTVLMDLIGFVRDLAS